MISNLRHHCVTAGRGGDAVVVLRPAEQILSEGAVRDVRRQFCWLVGEPARRGLHLDLAAVLAPTAGGLGGLVALHRQLRAEGMELILLNASAQSREVFRLTGLDALFDVRAG